jgi:cell cycle checkpoint protein
MADRPSKRQRRLAIESSALDVDIKTETYKTRNHHASVGSDRTNPVSLAGNSPQLGVGRAHSNPRAHTASLSADKGALTKSASPLYNFFEPASLEERCSSQVLEATCYSKEATEAANGSDIDDIIDDDYDSYDELFTQHFASDEFVARDVSQPQPSWREQSPQGSAGGARKYTNTHKHFILPLIPDHKDKNPYSLDYYHDYKLPWAQQYPPANLNELAVHKKKVSDVQSWLCHAFAGNTKHVSL